jgi:hypothetical protein
MQRWIKSAHFIIRKKVLMTYYGKGSTFPDVNGGIEFYLNKPARGHAQESVNGVLTFLAHTQSIYCRVKHLAAANGMRNHLRLSLKFMPMLPKIRTERSSSAIQKMRENRRLY